MAEDNSFKKQIAYKVRVADILNNPYMKEDGWLPNYISVGDKKVSRINVLGIIVSKEGTKESQNFILDDGSGRLALRFFNSASDVNLGDMVIVIGRPREFGNERYVVPEAIQKVTDPKWVEVRKLELELNNKPKPVPESVSEQATEPFVEPEEVIEESNPSEQIISIIKKNDPGDGVEFEDINSNFSGEDAEALVKKLLEQGDVFEVRPGKYKVLE